MTNIINEQDSGRLFAILEPEGGGEKYFKEYDGLVVAGDVYMNYMGGAQERKSRLSLTDTVLKVGEDEYVNIPPGLSEAEFYDYIEGLDYKSMEVTLYQDMTGHRIEGAITDAIPESFREDVVTGMTELGSNFGFSNDREENSKILDSTTIEGVKLIKGFVDGTASAVAEFRTPQAESISQFVNEVLPSYGLEIPGGDYLEQSDSIVSYAKDYNELNNVVNEIFDDYKKIPKGTVAEVVSRSGNSYIRIVTPTAGVKSIENGETVYSTATGRSYQVQISDSTARFVIDQGVENLMERPLVVKRELEAKKAAEQN